MGINTSSVAGQNGGVFLGISSPAPLVAFRVYPLEGGHGVLDNPRLDITALPKPSTLLPAGCGVVALATSDCGSRRFDWPAGVEQHGRVWRPIVRTTGAQPIPGMARIRVPPPGHDA